MTVALAWLMVRIDFTIESDVPIGPLVVFIPTLFLQIVYCGYKKSLHEDGKVSTPILSEEAWGLILFDVGFVTFFVTAHLGSGVLLLLILLEIITVACLTIVIRGGIALLLLKRFFHEDYLSCSGVRGWGILPDAKAMHLDDSTKSQFSNYNGFLWPIFISAETKETVVVENESSKFQATLRFSLKKELTYTEFQKRKNVIVQNLELALNMLIMSGEATCMVIADSIEEIGRDNEFLIISVEDRFFENKPAKQKEN
jgi:hypothetical protein